MIVTPKRFSNSLWISTGSAEPPEAATRRFLAISSTWSFSPSAPSRPQYIVGTPAKKVTFSLTSSSIAALGSKRGSSTTVPPNANAPSRITVWPKAWKSGSTQR